MFGQRFNHYLQSIHENMLFFSKYLLQNSAYDLQSEFNHFTDIRLSSG